MAGLRPGRVSRLSHFPVLAAPMRLAISPAGIACGGRLAVAAVAEWAQAQPTRSTRMFDNRNSEAGRSVGPSSAQLGALRRTWADAGRQAWDKATRTGQNVLARTQSELEALGRRELARVEALAQAGGQAIAKVAKATYDVIGGPVNLAGRMSRAGTDADPGPGLLVAEFATGRGPQRRVLEPSSSLSREYVRAPSVQGQGASLSCDRQRLVFMFCLDIVAQIR